MLGGSGFIGSHVVDQLLEDGHDVSVLDRAPEYYREPVPEVRYYFGDFLDEQLLEKSLVDIDKVVHLISTTTPGTAAKDPVFDVQSNLVGTLQLIQIMLRNGQKDILYLSSGGTVYGNPEFLPVSEAHPIRPICTYGVVKAAAENYLRLYQHLDGLRPLILRVSNPYGPRQGHIGVQGAIGTFLQRLKAGEGIEVWGDGSIERDFIYIEDLANLCVRAVNSDLTGTYNAGSGRATSINVILEQLELMLGRKIEVRYKETRKFDVQSVFLDCSKVKQELQFSPQTELLEGLQKTWDWFLSLKKPP